MTTKKCPYCARANARALRPRGRAVLRAGRGRLRPSRHRLLGARGPADLGRRARADGLRIHRLVRRSRLDRSDARGDRLAHRGARQARLLRRPGAARARRAARVRLRVAADRAREPRRDRARFARDDLRPRPADLDPGFDPSARRARNRYLDQPSCGARSDRRGTAKSLRRAVVTSVPRTAPPMMASGPWPLRESREGASAAIQRTPARSRYRLKTLRRVAETVGHARPARGRTRWQSPYGPTGTRRY